VALTVRDERPSASQLKLREIALDNSYPQADTHTASRSVFRSAGAPPDS